MAERLTGKEVSAHLAEETIACVNELKNRGIQPAIAVVRVGDRLDDVSYERTAFKRAEAQGIDIRHFVFPQDVKQDEMEAAIAQINGDETIHGCLMFRPLPESLDEKALCDLLVPKKDVDGISSASLSAIFIGDDEGFAPCTAAACLEVLDFYGIEVAGKNVAVVGRSLVVGKPVAMMLLARDATVTLCHSRTKDLAAITKAADIVICATGRARAYGAEYFSAGQVVLDVGINFDEEGVFCGDVDYEAVEPIVAAITPVPGGIGGVTTSVLMAHVAKAAQ